MIAVAAVGLLSSAHAQTPTPPRRQIPPAVLAELSRLESRFELALYTDCDAERCFAVGCTYVDHAVVDQPRATSLPGFGLDPGPGSVESQEFLTQARCAFAHEAAEEASDVQVLVRRLEARLSSGWLVVTVDNQPLQPLPSYMGEAPEDVDAEEEPEEEPTAAEPEEEPDWLTMDVAGRELWTTLLPHVFWMLGLLLATLSATMLIWSWRRVGQASVEEQLLLAQLGQPEAAPEPEGEALVEDLGEDPSEFIARQDAAWRERLAAAQVEPDFELQALIRERLLAGDLPLLARAVLRFPEHFPAAFPTGGEVAAAKLALADHLKTVDEQSLPADVDFFASLNRHALAAALASQSDARIVQSLREDFGTAGLADLIGRLPPRIGALLFALSPLGEQAELVRLLSSPQIAALSGQLLRSNRMDPAESAYLFDVLQAARSGAPFPAAPQTDEIADRGAAFDATGALSVLLPALAAHQRAALFADALRRFNGSFPAWYRGIFTAEMLSALTDEARADLMLSVEVEALAAWASLLSADERAAALTGLPGSLRNSIQAVSVFPSRSRQVALAAQGRAALARGFQEQLARMGLPLEHVLSPQGDA